MIRRRRFNLSDWALKHRSLVWFLLIVSMVAGLISYRGLGREEDPNFTIKVMVISAAMPGATIAETLDQVTDRIETKLEELDELDFAALAAFLAWWFGTAGVDWIRREDG